jgi:hypothetical protein
MFAALRLLNTARLIQAPLGACLLVVAGGSAFVLLILAVLPRPSDRVRWLILIAFLTEFGLGVYSAVQTSGETWSGRITPIIVQTDSAAYTEFAASLLRHGRNPYEWDYGGVMHAYGLGAWAGTPTLRGVGESPFPYPALAFLLAAPFQALGLPGVFTLLCGAQVLLYVLLFSGAPRRLQPVILFAVALSSIVNITALTLTGVMDIVWVVLLVGMLLAWEVPFLSAVLFGLAAAFKQGPWLVAPFLLLYVWRERSFLAALRFGMISGIAFLVPNAPFILANLSEWLRGVLEPLRDTLVYYSQGGISGLTQFGYLYLPKNFYLLASVLVLLALLFLYWHYFDHLRAAFWMLPGVFLWFSYRNLVTYWLYWLFPMVLMVARVDFTPRPAAPRSWKPALLTGIGLLVALPLLGVALRREPPLTLTLHAPYLVGDAGRVIQMDVTVTNHASKTIFPRFALQHAGSSANPIPTQIERGALTLAPGATDRYTVYTPLELDSFAPYEPAQLVVTDAAEDYDMRGVARLPADTSYLYPNAIPNPAFHYWNSGKTGPLFWIRDPAATDSALAVFDPMAGRDALRLTIATPNEETSRLIFENAVLLLDQPFQMGVYADAEAVRAKASFGIECDDGEHLFRLNFGAPPTSGILALPMAFQPGQWSDVVIDLPKIYREQGWTLPTPQKTVVQGIEAQFRLLRLRLYVQVDQPVAPVSVWFSAIKQETRYLPEDAMRETLTNLTDYYVRYAEEQFVLGNYARSRDAYERALRYAPTDDTIRTRLEQLKGFYAPR